VHIILLHLNKYFYFILFSCIIITKINIFNYYIIKMPNTGLTKFNLAIEKSLLLLEIPVIRFLVICLLVIYNSILIPPFNNVVSQWFRWFWFKLFYLLVIIYVAFKDKTVSLLLGISFVLSIQRLESTERYYAPVKYKSTERHSKKSKRENRKNKKNKRKNKKENDENKPIIEKKVRFNLKHDTLEGNGGNAGYDQYIQRCATPSITQDEVHILSQPIQTWTHQTSTQGLNCNTLGSPGHVDGSNIQ
jgi:hypothetical protein